MERLLHPFPPPNSSYSLIYPQKTFDTPPLTKLATGFSVLKPQFRSNCINLTKNGSTSAKNGDSKTEVSPPNWELEFLGELTPIPKNKLQYQSDFLRDTDKMDWCVKARKVALKSIKARGLTRIMENMIVGSKKKKKKKSRDKDNSSSRREKLIKDDEELSDEDASEEAISDSASRRRRMLAIMAGRMFDERRETAMEKYVQRLSEFSGPSDRKKEIGLNKAIVEAETAEEVMEAAAETISAVCKGLFPSPLSPFNIATALHRIAKNMEKVFMMRTQRLAFARQKEMFMLVGLAMTALPESSAQGISNIAWALSKIGGELLYLSEMDRVAEVAWTKVGEFNSQNIANVAGAFASMQHSAPNLFSELAKRAGTIVHTFQEKELAQVLWAFASLSEPADPLLESLDNVFKDASQFSCCLAKEKTDVKEEGNLGTNVDSESQGEVPFPSLSFNRNQLGNIAWSYAVLGKMESSFFSHIWRKLSHMGEEEMISGTSKEDIMFASQIYIANLCLKLEYPHLQLSLTRELEEKVARVAKNKKFNEKMTSSFQKQVGRILFSTGLDWAREYTVDGYTLDTVLVDHKVALEIDGPTHFSRNSGVPLGHTMLKRRYIKAAGWKLVSLSLQEWEELQGEDEQLDYLRRILSNHIGGSSVSSNAEQGAGERDESMDVAAAEQNV